MTERFVHNQNINRFRRLVAEAKDDDSRKVIQGLLDEELAKDDPLRGDGRAGPAPKSPQ